MSLVIQLSIRTRTNLIGAHQNTNLRVLLVVRIMLVVPALFRSLRPALITFTTMLGDDELGRFATNPSKRT